MAYEQQNELSKALIAYQNALNHRPDLAKAAQRVQAMQEKLKNQKENRNGESGKDNRSGNWDRTPEDPVSNSKWYEVLGVPEHASFKEVRAAYRKLMQEYHPDRVANLGKELRDLAERKAKKINEAYESFRKARQPL